MMIAALLALQVASEPPRITISETKSGYRAEVTAFDLSQEAYVGAQIEHQAAKLCADKQIHWEKFGSATKVEKDPAKESPKVTGFFKEFRCIVPREPVVASVASDWKAAGKDEEDVRRFFAAYYAKRDGGDFEDAAAMFQPGTREDSSPEYLREFNRKLGSGSRRITGVTWYVNPASAPRLGAYAALDFIGEYTGVHIYCGYLILYRLGPGRYEITREEQNIFERGAEAPDTAQLASMRAAACRGN